MKKRKVLTLIEFIVVIAVIALLVFMFLPRIHAPHEHAEVIVCKSNLHQWGMIFSLYANDYDSKYMPGIDEDWETGETSWIHTLMPYHDNPKIRLCPNSTKPEKDLADKRPLRAWNLEVTNPGQFTSIQPEYKTGSYGLNWWVTSGEKEVSGYDSANKWKSSNQPDASQIPVLTEAGFMHARVEADDAPPEYDGKFNSKTQGAKGMDRVCTNRHSGGVNILFMDWSVRKVKLMDLWNQQWHKNYEPNLQLPAFDKISDTWPGGWPEWIVKAN